MVEGLQRGCAIACQVEGAHQAPVRVLAQRMKFEQGLSAAQCARPVAGLLGGVAFGHQALPHALGAAGAHLRQPSLQLATQFAAFAAKYRGSIVKVVPHAGRQ